MIQFKRLEKLEQHLRKGKLAHKKFDFGCFNSDISYDSSYGEREKNYDSPRNICGTAGCALGECPAVFKQWKFIKDQVVLKGSQHGVHPFADARDFFGLDVDEAEHLFNPDSQQPNAYGGKRLDDTASRIQVAANIRAFINLKKLELQKEKLQKQINKLRGAFND
jgi:hypothetical protein